MYFGKMNGLDVHIVVISEEKGILEINVYNESTGEFLLRLKDTKKNLNKYFDSKIF